MEKTVKMSAKDVELINKAKFEMNCFQWTEVDDMEKEAESPEAKKILHDICRNYYLQEEVYCGVN